MVHARLLPRGAAKAKLERATRPSSRGDLFWAESEQITLSATGHKGDPKVSLPTLTEGTGHPPTPKRLRRGWSAGALIKYDSHNREPNEPSEAALGCGLGLPRERPRPRFLNGALGLR